MPQRVVIGGVSNCGTSTLAASVFRQLEELGVSVSLYEIDTFSDTIPCILGVKPWSERKKRPWGNWSDPEIYKRLKEFSEDEHGLVIGDLPGVIDDLLVKLVAPATAAIAMGKDEETLGEWEKFFCNQGIPVILRVISYLGVLPKLSPGSDVILVGNLCREVHMDGEVRVVADRLRQFYRSSG